MPEELVTLSEPLLTVDAPSKEDCSTVVRLVRMPQLIDEKMGYFEMESLLHPHFTMHEISVNLKYQAVVQPSQPSSTTTVGLALMLSGKQTSGFGGKVIQSAGGNGVFAHNPCVPESHRFVPNCEARVRYFEISSDYFASLFFDDLGSFENLREKVEAGQFVSHCAPISATQCRIMTDMKATGLTGSLRNLFLEASVQQLFALHLQSFDQMSEHATGRIAPRDKALIQEVKAYLDTCFLESLSLAGISRHFGINQNKLKITFRDFFGQSVFGYIHDLRMEHARKLLQDTDANVVEVASIVGYRYPNHFSAAFKRRFGMSPSKLKG